MPRLLSLDLALAANPARALVDRRERVRALVRVRADHDHMHRPFVWLTTDEADLGGQLSLGANATLLSSHAKGPRAATGDTTYASQASRSTSSLRVSPPPAREPTGRRGHHRPALEDDGSESNL
jgi:hypothetical protein